MEIKIRELRREDRELVEEFYRQMGPETRFFFNSADYNYRRTMKFFGENPDPNVVHWIAVLGGRIVGYVFVWNTGKKIVEMGLAVSEDLKGKRLGGRLIDTVKQWCRDHGKGGILLSTHPANIRAQALYNRSGFRHLGASNNRGEYLYLFALSEEDGSEDSAR